MPGAALRQRRGRPGWLPLGLVCLTVSCGLHSWPCGIAPVCPQTCRLFLHSVSLPTARPKRCCRHTTHATAGGLGCTTPLHPPPSVPRLHRRRLSRAHVWTGASHTLASLLTRMVITVYTEGQEAPALRPARQLGGPRWVKLALLPTRSPGPPLAPGPVISLPFPQCTANRSGIDSPFNSVS